MVFYGRVPAAKEFQFLQDRFSFLPELGVMIPAKWVSIYDLPLEKFGVPISYLRQGMLADIQFPRHDRGPLWSFR